MGMWGSTGSAGGEDEGVRGKDEMRRVISRPAAKKRERRLVRTQVLKASRWTSHTRSFLEMKKLNSWLGWAMERI